MHLYYFCNAFVSLKLFQNYKLNKKFFVSSFLKAGLAASAFAL